MAAKAARREKHRLADDRGSESPEPTEAPSASTSAAVAMPADAAAMLRLGQALAFVCGPHHPATLALQQAAHSGAGDDVQRARAMFEQLAAREQRVALAIATAAEPPPA